MKKEHFEKLVDSIKEAGEIKAGRKAASRVYEIKPPEIKMAHGDRIQYPETSGAERKLGLYQATDH